MIKNLFLIALSALTGLLFFAFHRLLAPTGWLSVGLAIGVLWYVIDPILLFPRYATLTGLTFPVSRSFWLLLIYWPLALFILTSTGSWLAQGLMMALGLGLGIDLIMEFSQPEQIKTIFNFPPQSKWRSNELQIVAVGWAVGLIVFIVLFVI